MRPAESEALQLVSGEAEAGVLRRRARGGRRSRWSWVGLAAAVAVVAAATTIGVRRAATALPAEQRAAVVSRAVHELKQFCGEPPPAALRDHCRELASFAARFDECRGECEALVRSQLAPHPTR